MSHGERGDHRKQSPEVPKRKHNARQEEKVVDPAQDVRDARLHERSRRLVPARIQRHGVCALFLVVIEAKNGGDDRGTLNSKVAAGTLSDR
jgi:hypothetical protein